MQIRRCHHVVDRLILTGIIQLVQDVVIQVTSISTRVLLVIIVGTILVVGRNGTGGVVGIVGRIDATDVILTVVVVAIDIQRQIKLFPQLDVQLCHPCVTTVGRVLDHIILIRIT